MFDSSQRLDPDTELPELAAAIAGLPAAQPGRTGLATGLRVRALLTLRRRLDAHLLAELDSFDTQGGATAYGFPTTQSWLRAYGNLDHGIAASMVASARLARRLPTLGDVLATGGIGVEHLAAITRSTRHIPEDVVAEHEATLGNLAPHARPSDLARAGRKSPTSTSTTPSTATPTTSARPGGCRWPRPSTGSGPSTDSSRPKTAPSSPPRSNR
jgi:hypothetical protein